MIKKKLFILISISTVLFLFGTAALCNQCSISMDDAEEQTADEQSQVDETGQQRLSDDNGNNADNGEEPPADDDPGDGDGEEPEESDGEEPSEEDNNPPVIETVILDDRDVTGDEELNAIVDVGLNFSVQASDADGDEMTYQPYFDNAVMVSEEQIDNNNYRFVLVPNAVGDHFLGIEVYDDEEGYCLWDVALSVGSEEGGSGGYVHDDMSFMPDNSLSGQIDEDRVATLASASSGTPSIYVGDTPVGGKTKGYLSFDISGLNGKNVAEAELVISSFTVIDEPSSLLGSDLDFRAVNYGNSLDGSDYRTGVYTYLAGMSPDRRSFTISGETFKNAVQEVLDDSGRAHFQVKISFENANSDGNADGFVILMDHVRLNITYYPA